MGNAPSSSAVPPSRQPATPPPTSSTNSTKTVSLLDKAAGTGVASSAGSNATNGGQDGRPPREIPPERDMASQSSQRYYQHLKDQSDNDILASGTSSTAARDIPVPAAASSTVAAAPIITRPTVLLYPGLNRDGPFFGSPLSMPATSSSIQSALPLDSPQLSRVVEAPEQQQTAQQHQQSAAAGYQPSVPAGGGVATILSWSGDGKDVAVAGTFTEWKYQIQLVASKSDFTTVLHLRPGTHRLKFFVDGQWRCSPDFETALDIHGNLVNYIEVKDERRSHVADLGDFLGSSDARSIHSGNVDLQLAEYHQELPAYLKPTPASRPASAASSTSSAERDTYLRSLNSRSDDGGYGGGYGGSGYSSGYQSGESLPPTVAVRTPPPPRDPLTTNPPPNFPQQLERIILNAPLPSSSSPAPHPTATPTAPTARPRPAESTAAGPSQRQQHHHHRTRTSSSGGHHQHHSHHHSRTATTGATQLDPQLLPVPDQVTLNHLYALTIRDDVMGLAVSTRYRNKYVTTILYAPLVHH